MVLELQLPALFILRRGGSIIARRASPKDKSLVVDFYESLDLESVYMRFLHIVKDFTKYVDLILDEKINRFGAVVLGFEADSKSLVAVSEVFSKEGLVGELAVTVREGYRSRGLGTLMTILASLEAYHRGVRVVEAYISRDNAPALSIARKIGLEVKYIGSDTCRARAVIDSVYPNASRLLDKIVEKWKVLESINIG